MRARGEDMPRGKGGTCRHMERSRTFEYGTCSEGSWLSQQPNRPTLWWLQQWLLLTTTLPVVQPQMEWTTSLSLLALGWQ